MFPASARLPVYRRSLSVPRALFHFAAVLCLLFPLALSAAWGQSVAPNKPEVRATLGVHFLDICAANFPEQTVTVRFLLWLNYPVLPGRVLPEHSLDLLKYLRIANEQEETELDADILKQTKKQGRMYQLVRVKAVLHKPWTVDDFPFDWHTVRLIFALVPHPDYRITLAPDPTSALPSDIRLIGWDISRFQAKIPQTGQIHSLLGDPEAREALTVPQVEFTFRIARNRAWLVFFRTFFPLFAATILAILALGIRPDELEVRSSIAVGSLFAAIGGQFVISSSLPTNSIPTLAELIYITSYLCISMSIYALIKRATVPKASIESPAPVSSQATRDAEAELQTGAPELSDDLPVDDPVSDVASPVRTDLDYIEDRRTAQLLAVGYIIVIVALCVYFGFGGASTAPWWHL